MLRAILFALCLLSLQAQTVFHTPGSNAGSPQGTTLCIPFTPSDGQLLSYAASRGCWLPGTAASGGGFPYSAVSGISAAKAGYPATGLTQTFVEPGQTPLPNTGNLQAGVGNDIYAGGLFNPANYGNIVGNFQRCWFFNGFNSPDNGNKDTLGCAEFNAFYNGSGQKYGFGAGATCWGTGDCLGISTTTTYGNRTTAWGDEGVKALWILMQQQGAPMSQSAGTVTTSNCAVTALAANVASSNNGPSDIKTVAVTGSISACKKGDWLDIDNGVFGAPAGPGFNYCGGATPGGPYTDYCHESVQLTADASSGSISALFHLAHTSGAPVAPSPVITVTGGGQYGDWGQDAILVDGTAATSTVGTSTPTLGSKTVTGIGTSWSTGLVGGDADLPGCITWAADNVTSDPFSADSPLVSWFPIQSMSGTSMTLGLAYTGSAPASSAHVIAPCGETSQLTVNYGSATDSVNGLVMRSTAGSWGWTSGHTITQIISPNSSVGNGVQVIWNGYGPHATVPDLFYGGNLGYVQASSALTVQGSPLSSTIAGFKYGIRIPSTQVEQISMGQPSYSSVAILMSMSDTDVPNSALPSGGGVTGDVKALVWGGGTAHDPVAIYPGDAGRGFWINDSNGARLTLANNQYAYATIDATQTGGNAFYVLPPGGGTFFTPQGGTLQLTLPASSSQSIDIGSVQTNYNSDVSVDLWACTGIGDNQCSRYQVQGIAPDSSWRIVAPVSTSYDSPAIQLEAASALNLESQTALNLRLRGGSGQVVAITLVAEGVAVGHVTFTPDSTVNTTTAPTAYWPSAFMTQVGNKLLLNYTSSASVTFDPTGVAANVNETVPTLGGTLGVMVGSTPADNATCTAGQLWFDASYLYVCTVSGTVKRAALSSF